MLKNENRIEKSHFTFHLYFQMSSEKIRDVMKEGFNQTSLCNFARFSENCSRNGIYLCQGSCRSYYTKQNQIRQPFPHSLLIKRVSKKSHRYELLRTAQSYCYSSHSSYSRCEQKLMTERHVDFS